MSLDDFENESESKISIRSFGLKNGIILGLASIIMFMLFQFMGVSQQSPLQWLNTLVMIALMVYALNNFKKEGDGFMSFGQGFGIGFWMAAISGVISATFTVIYMTVIDPNYVDRILRQTRVQMEKQNPNLTDEQLDMALSYSEYVLNPGAIFAIGIVGALIFGSILSLIIAAIMQKNRPEFS